MEGITDIPYRKTIAELDPAWDYLCTDFYRVPTVGNIRPAHIIRHLGDLFYNDEKLKVKTIFQILTSPNAQTEQAVKMIQELAIPYLDLNIGCPSRKVNAHHGGSYLLTVPEDLQKIVKIIRKNFTGRFSVKMRVGYHDDSNFIENLKMLEGEGVELITLHARTKKELYKGIANWEYIKKAKETLSIPLVGNGDIWSTNDIDKVINKTMCDHIMIGRGALKTPWLASVYRNQLDKKSQQQFTEEMIGKYFDLLEKNYFEEMKDANLVLKRFKAVSRYIFDDFTNGEEIKKNCLRTKSLDNFKHQLTLIETLKF